MFSSTELVASSLQTGFLAFAVYLSAIVLKTLLRGRSLLWYHCDPECHNKDDCNNGEDCIDGGGIDDGGEDCIDCGGDPTQIVTIVLQVPRVLPSVDPMSVVSSFVNPCDQANMLFTSSKFNLLNEKVQGCVETVMNKYLSRSVWYSIVNVQECGYSGGHICGSLKPVVTILDTYYTGSAKLDNEVCIFNHLTDSLIETLSKEVWNEDVHVTTVRDKIVPQHGNTLSLAGRFERPALRKVDTVAMRKH